MLYRFAWRMTGSPSVAEDLVHDCFLMLWQDAVTFDPTRGALRGFLIGVIRNLALKRLCKERPHEKLEETAAVFNPLVSLGLERTELVEQAIAQLPPLQREALILAEYEEMSLDEIVEVTGAELAAVKSRLHRARENVRRMLAPLLEIKGSACGTGK